MIEDEKGKHMKMNSMRSGSVAKTEFELICNIIFLNHPILKRKMPSNMKHVLLIYESYLIKTSLCFFCLKKSCSKFVIFTYV